MTDQKKIPQIRFRGFNREWEEKTLGGFGSVAMNKRIFKDQTSPKGDVPFYKIGTFGKEPDSFISRELFEQYKEQYPYPQKGDLLISASGSIGRVVEYEGKDEYFQDSNIVWLDHDDQVLNPFLKQFYSFVKWAGLEGSTIKRLYNKNILDTKIDLPLPEEQSQIGTYFEELDRLIDLHRQKQKKLLTLKKGMLNKMFPVSGSSTPDIRFKGFSAPWGGGQLKNYATFSKGQGYSKGDLVELGSPIVLYGRLYTSYQTEISDVDTYVREQKGSVKSTGKEVLVPSSGESAADIARASAVIKAGLILGGDLNVILPSSSIDSSFLALAISNGTPQQDLVRRAQGKSVVHLRNTDLEAVEVRYPSLEEQQKISAYFRQLDELLSQYGAQFEKLKQLKAACLETMFVQGVEYDISH